MKKNTVPNQLAASLAIFLTGVAALNPQVFGQTSRELPTAEAIMDRYIEVTGGAEVYANRTSEVSHATLQIPGAGTVPVITYTAPGLQYSSLEFPGLGQMESGLKDGIAWEDSLALGPQVKSGAERAQVMREGRLNKALWRELYTDVEVTGIESVEGQDAYRVVQIPIGEGSITTYYSVETGLAIKSTMVAVTSAGELPTEMTFQEYKEFGGILMPAKTIINQAGQRMMLTLESLEANVDIPAQRFEIPANIQALSK